MPFVRHAGQRESVLVEPSGKLYAILGYSWIQRAFPAALDWFVETLNHAKGLMVKERFACCAC